MLRVRFLGLLLLRRSDIEVSRLAFPVQHLELFIATYIESLTRPSLLSMGDVRVMPGLRSQAKLSTSGLPSRFC